MAKIEIKANIALRDRPDAEALRREFLAEGLPPLAVESILDQRATPQAARAVVEIFVRNRQRRAVCEARGRKEG